MPAIDSERRERKQMRKFMKYNELAFGSHPASQGTTRSLGRPFYSFNNLVAITFVVKSFLDLDIHSEG